MLEVEALVSRIRQALADAVVEIKDATGTGDHFEAQVVSEVFAGKTMVEQHQLVYAPLQDWLKTGALHALALRTYTPAQWAEAQARQRKKA